MSSGGSEGEKGRRESMRFMEKQESCWKLGLLLPDIPQRWNW
jgi:hypothetical protein